MISSQPTRISIAGIGFGCRTIAPAVKKLPVQIQGMYGGPNVEKTKEIVQKENMGSAYADYNAMLNDSDLVFVASPHQFHEEMVRSAILKNKHIVCEKPLALTEKGVVDLIDKSHQSDKIHIINHELRFNPFLNEIKTQLPKIGRLTHIDIYFETTRLKPDLKWVWWFDEKAGGGMLYAMGTHFTDFVEYISDQKISTISGQCFYKIPSLLDDAGTRHLNNSETGFEMTAQLDGLNATIFCDGASQKNNFSIRITGEHGSFVFSEPDHAYLLQNEKQVPILPEHHTSSVWKDSFECFLEKLISSIQLNDGQIMREASTFADFEHHLQLINTIRNRHEI